MPGRRRVDHDQVPARAPGRLLHLLQMPDLPESDQLAPAGRGLHQLPEGAVAQHQRDRRAHAELQRQVFAERREGIDLHRGDAGMDLAAGIAGGGSAGREEGWDLLVAPDLDQQHAPAGAGRGDRQRGGHGGLPGAPLAGHDHQPALEQRGMAQRCHGPSARGAAAPRRRVSSGASAAPKRWDGETPDGRKLGLAEGRGDPSTGVRAGGQREGPLIVTCEQCATQFHLDDAKVPPGGVRVRCSRCKHAFFIAPGGEEPELGGVDRAAQDALDAEAPPAPEPSEDLSAPAESGSDLAAADSDLDDGEDLASESDWEFNQAPFDAESAEPGPTADARDAAREAIDDLLGSRTPEPRTAAPAPIQTSEDEDLGKPRELGSAGRRRCRALCAAGAGRGRREPSRAGRRAFQASGGAGGRVDPAPRALGRAGLDRAHGARHRVERDRAALRDRRDPHALARERSDAEAHFGRQRVAGLEAQGVSGRWVENAVSGSLYVVSGRLVNPTAQAAALGTRIGVRLLDASGARLPIELAAAGPVLEERVLRESDPAGIQTRQAEAGLALAAAVIPPGQSLAFEAVVRDVPLAAARFLLEPFAPARARPAAAGEPEPAP